MVNIAKATYNHREMHLVKLRSDIMWEKSKETNMCGEVTSQKNSSGGNEVSQFKHGSVICTGVLY